MCPTCYREIPATISVTDVGVVMTKRCPAHGESSAVMERNPIYYMYASSMVGNSIYGGHFVDVTRTCQLRCNPCYYRLEKSDPDGLFSIESIRCEMEANAGRVPFILTGGEPTLHPQIVDIVRMAKSLGGVELLTNGIKLSNREFFFDIVPELTDRTGVAHINLSIHHEETDDWKKVVDLCSGDGRVKLESALIVVRNKEEFISAIKLCKELSDSVVSFRIKAASKVWNASEDRERIYVSDMIGWLEELGGEMNYVLPKNSKPCFFNVLYDKMHLMLVSWYDVTNVDLNEINCPPTYRARNGSVYDFIKTNLVNEGMERGWLMGSRIESVIPAATKFKLSSIRKPDSDTVAT